MNLYNVLDPILSEARKIFIRKIELGLFKLINYTEEDNKIDFTISIEKFNFQFFFDKKYKVISQYLSDIDLYKMFFDKECDDFINHVKNKYKEYKNKEKEMINSLEETK